MLKLQKQEVDDEDLEERSHRRACFAMFCLELCIVLDERLIRLYITYDIIS